MSLTLYGPRVRSSEMLGGTGAKRQSCSFKVRSAGCAQSNFLGIDWVLAVTANPFRVFSCAYKEHHHKKSHADSTADEAQERTDNEGCKQAQTLD